MLHARTYVIERYATTFRQRVNASAFRNAILLRVHLEKLQFLLILKITTPYVRTQRYHILGRGKHFRRHGYRLQRVATDQ